MGVTTTTALSPSISPPPECEWLEEFFACYDEYGLERSNPVDRLRAVPVRIRTPVDMTDAHHIVEIYQHVYQGTYPFLEMLDPQYILERLADPTWMWGLFVTTDLTSRAEIVVGCFSIVMDFENRSAYFRGLNILPQFQKQVGVRELASAMCIRFLSATQGRIDKWYMEARTVHTSVQYIARKGAAKYCGFLLNKDYFMHRKESESLQVAYWHDTLEQTRVPPKQILAHVYPLYNLVARAFELEESLEILPSITMPFVLTHSGNIPCLIEDQRDQYGYHHIIMTDPLSSSWLNCLYTESVKNIEKIQYHYTDGDAFLRLIETLDKYVDSQHIEYVEWQVPISDLILQEILYFYGWHLEGYIPAWRKTEDGHFKDVVVYARTTLPPRTSIKVLPEGQTLLTLIIPASTEAIPSVDRVVV